MFVPGVGAASEGGTQTGAAAGPPTEILVITGTVLGIHGKPVPDAEVIVRINGKEVHPGEKRGKRHGVVTSNSGGFMQEIRLERGAAQTADVELDIVKTSFRNIEKFKVKEIILSGRAEDGTQRYLFNGKFVLPREAGPAFYISAVILVFVYILIGFELVHRTLAAMLGAMLMLFISYTAGTFYPEFFIISFENAMDIVDYNVIFLLMGMMIIVGIMKETGVFQWFAYKAYQHSGGSVWRLAVILMVVTAVSSAFLDNVTTMLLLTPVTVEIALVLGLNPISLLMPLVLASNIGGTATLIGDPPNIMIGSFAGLTFNDFVMNLSVVIGIILVFHIIMMKFIYGKEYAAVKVDDVEALTQKLREEYRITDAKLLKYSLALLGVVIIFFIIHGVLHMEPSIAALSGAAVLLLISRVDIVQVLEKDVEWSTLIFFIMLFIIVGACQETGLIQIIADWVQRLSGGDLVTGILLVLWVSAIMSSLIDNIPFTATMLPVVAFLSETTPGAETNILWWALALGACLGGNGTLIGASANVVTAGLVEKAGYPLKFVQFMKIGIPVTLMSLVISSIWLVFVAR
jgi:Na+/H+ antiporter NhaD/arsenite permease-like protein